MLQSLSPPVCLCLTFSQNLGEIIERKQQSCPRSRLLHPARTGIYWHFVGKNFSELVCRNASTLSEGSEHLKVIIPPCGTSFPPSAGNHIISVFKDMLETLLPFLFQTFVFSTLHACGLLFMDFQFGFHLVLSDMIAGVFSSFCLVLPLKSSISVLFLRNNLLLTWRRCKWFPPIAVDLLLFAIAQVTSLPWSGHLRRFTAVNVKKKKNVCLQLKLYG